MTRNTYRMLAGMIGLMLMVTACAFGKDGRSFYDEETLGRARDRIARYEWARTQVSDTEDSAAWFMGKSLEELWDFVPPPEQLRALNVSFGVGCPDCGKKIFREGGHYPWKMSRDAPFKVTCPVCSHSFPENDFEPWNTDSLTEEPVKTDVPTDYGPGWLAPDGKRYFFVGTYIFWQRWQRDVLPGIQNLARAYLLTDNADYGRRAAAMLVNLASNYPRFDYRTQAYHNGRWPAAINGRILDYIWENGVITRMSLAYDALYPLFDDPDLRAFLAEKGVDDPRALIETNMLGTMIDDLRRGFVRGNMGMHQQAMCYAAIVLDNEDPAAGPTTAELRDWVMTGGGTTEYLLWNGFYRDGHGGESSPGYSSGWCVNFYTVARLLPRLGVDIWSNPKVRKMADIGPDLFVAETSCPSIGDCGTIFGAGRVGWSAALQGPAFTHYGDSRYARVLEEIGAESKDLFDDLFDEDAVAKAAAGTTLTYRTRNLGGYGLAILESGRRGARRGACMYYGHAGGGHGHRDRLTIQLMAYGKPFLTDMGYPAHWLPKNTYWTSNTISHYCVVVDQAWQQTMNRGYLNTIADAGFAQFMDASAESSAYPSTTSLYRRSTALIDIDEENSYLLDIFRVRGGRQHDYSYHGPPFPKFSVAGATPGPVQETGTLAGPRIPFGSLEQPAGDIDSGLVLPLRKSQDVLDGARPYAERGAEAWATYASGNTILTNRQGALMDLPIAEVGPGPIKVFLKVHDYNAGTNTVTVGLGPYEKEMSWEPSGATGYRWISTVLELPVAVSRFTMAATQVGQSWVLIQDVVLSRKTDAQAPVILGAATSGFQYLFNVRRMAPEGTWSATWRDPDEDLALTMTVPAGTAETAILADAEPELKPNHPDTLQYVLLRRKRADDAEKDLDSTFITVSEPHRGNARVTGVDRLKPAEGNAPENAVGVAVHRGTETDLVHSSLDPNAQCQWATPIGVLSVSGTFAVVTVDGQGVRRACLVEGTSADIGNFHVTAPASPQGRIESVDHTTNAVVLDQPLDAPEAWIGRVVICGNDLNQTSYTVVTAENRDGHAVLGFGTTLMLVQMGLVKGVDADAATLTLDKLERVDGKQHQGRWIHNENRSLAFRITDCKGNAFTVDAADTDLDAAFADADGDGQTRFWISDIGPGDQWKLAGVTVVDRMAQ